MSTKKSEINRPRSSEPRTAQKYFTLAEANNALVLVRRIVADIVKQYQWVVQLHEQSQEDEASVRPVHELEELEDIRQAAAQRLSDLSMELSEIGCELKDWESGLVDFYARYNGRMVCLCWRLGEDRITHWHEVQAGFSGRVAIVPEDCI